MGRPSMERSNEGDLMSKHIMSMTYAPKVDAVQDGRCTQTIRGMRKKKINAGDSILLHGWADPTKPYNSKWNNLMRVTVTDVIYCFVSAEGLQCGNTGIIPWDDILIDIIARDDFIDPPTGLALRDVLFKLNGAPSTPERYQIIRWRIDREATEKLRKEARECTN